MADRGVLSADRAGFVDVVAMMVRGCIAVLQTNDSEYWSTRVEVSARYSECLRALKSREVVEREQGGGGGGTFGLAGGLLLFPVQVGQERGLVLS